MLVKLTYIKPSGRPYAEGGIEVNVEWGDWVSLKVREKLRGLKQMPGLSTNWCDCEFQILLGAEDKDGQKFLSILTPPAALLALVRDNLKVM